MTQQCPHLVQPYFELLVLGACHQGKQCKLLHGRLLQHLLDHQQGLCAPATNQRISTTTADQVCLPQCSHKAGGDKGTPNGTQCSFANFGRKDTNTLRCQAGYKRGSWLAHSCLWPEPMYAAGRGGGGGAGMKAGGTLGTCQLIGSLCQH